jgi:hypothetical protein
MAIIAMNGLQVEESVLAVFGDGVAGTEWPNVHFKSALLVPQRSAVVALP